MTTLRICFLGDSITIGTGDNACRGWPSYLSAAETARGHDVSCYNLGIRAETGAQIGARWRAECAPRLPAHVDGRLVFMFGVNDSADQTGHGPRVHPDDSVAAARVTIAEAAAWKPTVWIGPTPVARGHPSITPGPGVTYVFDRSRTAALNRRYKDAAAALDVPYIDLFERLVEDGDWNRFMDDGDGVHPPDDGHRRIAQEVSADPAWRAWFD